MQTVLLPEKHSGKTWAKEFLKHRYATRSILWLVLIGLSIASLRFVATQERWLNGSAQIFLELCIALLSGGIIYALWVEYCVSAERRILLSAIAFSGIAVSHLAHSLLLLGKTYPALWLSCSLWQIASACLLIAAGHTDSLASKQNCRREGIRLLSACLLPAGIVSMVIVQASLSWPKVRGNFSVHLSPFDSEIGRILFSPQTAHLLALVAFAAALVTFACRYMEREDALSSGLARSLLLFVASEATFLTSARQGDLAWWIAYVWIFGGLVVLLVKLGMEFGASYAAAHQRIERLQSMYYITSRLNATLDLSAMLSTFVSDASSMLRARFVSVMLANEAGDALTTTASAGLP
ncbi:MAG: hypothetical protein ACYC08_09885, partial [Armatimonadota bacterium]